MANVIGPNEAPHGVTVLLMARYEAEALAVFLHEAKQAGAISTNTDVSDVYEALREDVLANVFTPTEGS